MENLININGENGGKQVVSARELYKFLGIQTDFTDWCKRMFDYGFENGRDYTILLKNEDKPVSKSNPVDYALTIDTAKEISMLQRSDKGKQARQYFIEVEKKLRESTKPLSTLDMLEMSIKQLREQEQRVSVIENDVLVLKAKSTTRPDYFTIAGYGTLNGYKVTLTLAARLGRLASGICKRENISTDTIPDPRFGVVKMYPTEILREVFNQVIIN